MTTKRIKPKNYGEKGKSRVRVWQPRPGSDLMIAVWKDGKLTNARSLGHRDEEKAEAQAYELIALLERARLERSSEPTPESVASNGRVRLGDLVQLYYKSASFKSLKPKTQTQKKFVLDMLVEFFGAARDVTTLDEEDIKHLQECRRKGLEGLPKAPGQQTMYSDFSILRSVLRWALKTKDEQGRKLLREYPLAGISVPHNPRPRQVLITHDEFTVLRRTAKRFKPHYRVFLVTIEGTGRRCASVINLEWDDLDLDAGTVVWKGEKDKMGTETHVALPRHVLRMLRVWRRMNPDDKFVFQKNDGRRGYRPKQGPQEPRPYTVNAAQKWMVWLFEKAGIEKPKGAGWHSLRRKWVTERKDLPDPDVMAAGGWRSVSAFKRYQRPDPETTRMVIERPTKRLLRKGNLKQQPKTKRAVKTSVSRNSLKDNG
ncbi:MAG TPA: tyrosine-type recombinase/integrase [Longimicrobiales bacterium]